LRGGNRNGVLPLKQTEHLHTAQLNQRQYTHGKKFAPLQTVFGDQYP
jgi:hypothetical protein